jgi:hypothetical protein
MQRFAKTKCVIPRSYTLDGVKKLSNEPLKKGGFGDVLKGRYQNRDVCIKVIRLYQSDQYHNFIKVGVSR